MGKKKITGKKFKGLTLQFIPYHEIDGLDSAGRIKKLLQSSQVVVQPMNFVKNNHLKNNLILTYHKI